jgi:hypothetical protein
MTYATMYSAIETVITGAVGAAPVQLPNELVNIVNADSFVRVTHLPAAAMSATLGTSGQNFRPGITQVDVFIKAGTGASSIPDAIVAAFPRGLMVANDFGDLYQLIAHRDGGELDPDGEWWQERVVIQWKALTSF